MKIYTGLVGGEKLKKVKEYDLGIMISSTSVLPRAEHAEFSCALDNGAFSSYKLNQPFNEYQFLRTIDACQRFDINPDFTVLPDIVGGGWSSLNFSKMWLSRLRGAKLALAVQDEMMPNWIHEDILFEVETIFVGGTVAWKWKHAKMWVDFAHENGRKCHIGQCGKLEFLREALRIGADSCDSTSFVVNDAWHILDEFIKPKQKELIEK